MVLDDHGTLYKYEKLRLATGGTLRRLPFGPQDIIYYRTLDDYRRLCDMSERGERFGVIGGGFIVSEIAAALAMNGKKVTMFFPDIGIWARIYPAEIFNCLNEFFRQKGVEIISGIVLRDIQTQDDVYRITTDKGEEIQVDGLVAGNGIQPNAVLARTAGLQIGNGIAIDEILRKSHADIFAAGDVTEFYNPALSKHLRLEHEDNANSMGKQAGRNMDGADDTIIICLIFIPTYSSLVMKL